VGSRHRLCQEPRPQVLGKEPWPRKKSPWGLCRALPLAKPLPTVYWPLPRVCGSRQRLDFQ
jgi:hypothetical protein